MWAREAWRPVLGFEGFYEVSSFGRVRRVAQRRVVSRRNQRDHVWHLSMRLLALSHTKTGYLSVALCRHGVLKRKLVHRLVCEAFLGPMGDLHTNHRDGVKTNNCIENLEAVTPRENNQHASRTGLWCLAGENGSNVKLTAKEVRQIVAAYTHGHVGYRRLGQRFGVDAITIRDIIKGKTWRSVTEERVGV